MGLALAAFAPTVVGASVAAADTVVALEQRPTPVAGHGSTAAWSSWSPERRGFLLKALVGDRVTTLPVRPRPVPFDVDLGPDARGRLVAVYARCAAEVPLRPSFSSVYYTKARGCRLLRFDFATRRERRIPGTHATGASEYLPTIWGARLAWARRTSTDPSAPPVDRLLTRRLDDDPHRRPDRLPGGTPGPGFASDDPPHPNGLDLRGAWLAFTWSDVSHLNLDGENFCPRSSDRDEPRVTEAWSLRLGDRRRELVERACETEEASNFRSVSNGPRGLLYLADTATSRIRRLQTRFFSAPGPDGLISVAQTDGGLVASRETTPPSEPDRIEIVRLDPPAFVPTRPLRRPFDLVEP